MQSGFRIIPQQDIDAQHIHRQDRVNDLDLFRIHEFKNPNSPAPEVTSGSDREARRLRRRSHAGKRRDAFWPVDKRAALPRFVILTREEEAGKVGNLGPLVSRQSLANLNDLLCSAAHVNLITANRRKFKTVRRSFARGLQRMNDSCPPSAELLCCYEGSTRDATNSVKVSGTFGANLRRDHRKRPGQTFSNCFAKKERVYKRRFSPAAASCGRALDDSICWIATLVSV